MEKRSNKEYSCADKFEDTLSNFKSQIAHAERRVKFECPKLPESTHMEDILLEKIIKSGDESHSQSDSGLFWTLFGAGVGFFALPALGFGALGPAAGSFAACKNNLNFLVAYLIKGRSQLFTVVLQLEFSASCKAGQCLAQVRKFF